MSDSLDAAVLTLVRLARVLERAAAPMSLADVRALSAIVGGEERASRLAHRLAVGKPSISATVDSLERRGLVTRRPSSADQRAASLEATAAGRAACDEAVARMADRIRELTAGTGATAAGLTWLADLGDALDDAAAERIARIPR